MVPFVDFVEMTMLKLGSPELEISFTMAWLLWHNLDEIGLIKRNCKFCRDFVQHHGGMLLMNQAVTFSLDIGIQDLMVDCSNFRLIVPL